MILWVKRMKTIPEIQAVRDRMMVCPLNDIKGQVKRIDYQGGFIIIEFEDGQWVGFQAHIDYDNQIEIEYLRERKIEPWALRGVKLISEIDLQNHYKLEDDLRKQQEISREELIYQKVKARKEKRENPKSD